MYSIFEYEYGVPAKLLLSSSRLIQFNNPNNVRLAEIVGFIITIAASALNLMTTNPALHPQRNKTVSQRPTTRP
ncbi:19098_t:CDS:2 [Funneliformis geosporum]|uniref:19098_t:CDS:1 n=1 Tax=Funneliformis geosporum TaxID=1117311 RepID=A0A9W4STR7_9GLOM|nr:19098_t:CDS:2 [Funneliformis geosporum]